MSERRKLRCGHFWTLETPARCGLCDKCLKCCKCLGSVSRKVERKKRELQLARNLSRALTAYVKFHDAGMLDDNG